MTTFIVNGKEKEIEMRDENGIDWSDDFVGNNSHGIARDDEGRWIVSEDDYNWWASTIAAHEEMTQQIRRYKNEYGNDAVDQQLTRMFNGDLEDWPGDVSRALSALSDAD